VSSWIGASSLRQRHRECKSARCVDPWGFGGSCPREREDVWLGVGLVWCVCMCMESSEVPWVDEMMLVRARVLIRPCSIRQHMRTEPRAWSDTSHYAQLRVCVRLFVSGFTQMPQYLARAQSSPENSVTLCTPQGIEHTRTVRDVLSRP